MMHTEYAYSMHTLTKAVFGKNKKGGQIVFFFEKIKGGEDFFQLKKGPKTFFSEKIRGRGLFFRLKKGCEDFFQANFSQNPA